MLSFINKNELQIQQLKLEDEAANSWLVLKFLSPIDHLHDVLIIEISGIHCFGLTKSSKPVNSTDKALIGNIFNVMLSSKLKTDYNNFMTLQLVNQSYDSQLKKIDNLENQNKLIIENASASCGCTVPDWPKEPIAPGAKSQINVKFDSKGKKHVYKFHFPVENKLKDREDHLSTRLKNMLKD